MDATDNSYESMVKFKGDSSKKSCQYAKNNIKFKKVYIFIVS